MESGLLAKFLGVDWLFWWQLPLLLLLIGVIVFYMQWRKKQM
jgi:cytochrome c-type biogenesis protein CcmH/NrfF